MHVPMTVVQSPEIASPALLGFLRPRLLLPERLLESFDRDALRLLFLHEIAHAKRRDILVNWLATAVHVVHWWNPLVAYASRPHAGRARDRDRRRGAGARARRPPGAATARRSSACWSSRPTASCCPERRVSWKTVRSWKGESR